MNWAEQTTQLLEELLAFAEENRLFDAIDRPYYRNLLLDVIDLDAPEGNPSNPTEVPATATGVLKSLCDLAVEKRLD